MWSLVSVRVVLVVTCVPPVIFVYHPSNEYPVLVTVGNVPYVFPYVNVFVCCYGVPPFP